METKKNVLHQMLFLDEILCIKKLLNKHTHTKRLIEIAKLEVNSISLRVAEQDFRLPVSFVLLGVRSYYLTYSFFITDRHTHRTIANRIPKLFIAKQKQNTGKV